MAEPGKPLRELGLAVLGALAAGSERAEELVNEWSSRTGIEPATLYRELGLVPRAELEDLQLRLAQLEHRLRLLEGDRPPRPPAAA